MVNHYGQMAMDHWRAHRPHAFRLLADPSAYFQSLGEEVQAAITSLRDDLLVPVADQQLTDTRREAHQAYATAEEIVLTELVWLREEPAPSDPDPMLDQHYRILLEVNTAIGSSPIE